MKTTNKPQLGNKKTNVSMDKAMKHIAQIHLRHDTTPDWIFHQIIRFLFDGYPHHSGPLFKKLASVEGQSLRVKGLRLILEDQAIRPTPFGNLCPIQVGSEKDRRKLSSFLKNG